MQNQRRSARMLVWTTLGAVVLVALPMLLAGNSLAGDSQVIHPATSMPYGHGAGVLSTPINPQGSLPSDWPQEAPPGWSPPLPTEDQTLAEHGTGWLPSPPGSFSVGPPPSLHAQQVLPSLVDLGWAEPPVGDQGTLGSCTAWATSYYYKTFQEYREHGWSVTTSDHQFSPSFVYNQTNHGVDNGANLSEVFNLIANKGDDTWAVFPYTSFYTLQPTAAQLQAALPYRAASYGTFFKYDHWWKGFYGNDITPLKQQLASGDTLVIAIPTYSSFKSGYSSWACQYVWNGPYQGDPYTGDHALQVVGYNDNNRYFRVINSWGTSWGCQGFGYLSYDFVVHYAYEAWWMVDRLNDFSPTPTPAPYPYPAPPVNRTWLPIVWR